jgi:hypothetical protein
MGLLLGLMGWVLVAFTTFWVGEEFGTTAGILYFLFFSGVCFIPVALVAAALDER